MNATIPKLSVFSRTREEILSFLKSLGEPRFRSEQVCEWLFDKRIFRLEQMSNIPKSLKLKLEEAFDWSLPDTISALSSPDGATKLLLQGGASRQFIESVILRYEGRTSLCVSSQVGCKLACSFCQTGKLGFFRNLTAGEIISQFALAQEIVAQEGRNISHIVFMGMGEPLDNYEQVVRAVNLLSGEEHYGISARRVTVSTSGIVPKILPLAKDTRCSLAVSLHACRDELRSELMPINRKYDLADLKAALLEYQKETGDKITLEYILIQGKNCGLREAKELVKFIHGLRVKVNLIPFNSHPGLAFSRPWEEEILQFQKYLSDRSIPAPVRYSKGLEVSGACGQLAAKQLEALEDVPSRRSALGPAAILATLA